MPLRFKHRILEHLSHGTYRPAEPDEIARDLRIESDDQDAFDQAVRALAKEGRISLKNDGRVRLPDYPEEISGKLRLNARGFGFIIPDTPYRYGDLFVPRGKTRDAVSGDRVRAAVVHQPWRKSSGGKSEFIAIVEEVLERGQDCFVGTLTKKGKNWFVEPDGRSLYQSVLVRDPHAKNAKSGDKVVIELVHYPEGDYVAEGVITKVLGESGRPGVETQAVIVAHGIRTDFPDAVVEEARNVSRPFDADAQGPWDDREDLTGEFIFTIDPPDAKDFDDAISIEHDEGKGEWTLGVHIADVANFVRKGSELDNEAVKRGNSTYLPRLVLPMLPEVLSNGVCSLQEGVNRFAKSVFITFDSKGNVLRQRHVQTVIRSRKRLTYLEAQGLIDGDETEARKNAVTETQYTETLREKLKLSDRLARNLRKRRMRDGMIVLNLPEVELVFDEDGHVIDAVPEDDAFTHKIIEMFMVEANEAVARTFSVLNVPLIRRIHPEPVSGDVQELRMYARVAKQDLPDEPTRKDLQRLLEATKGTPAARAIHFAVLRTLTKATYSPAIIGHFALASEHYAHFTSPIRRYPDLTVHRALHALVKHTDNGRTMPKGKNVRSLARKIMNEPGVLDEGEAITVGRHCSETEVASEGAERDLRDFLVMQFLKEHHLGEEFPGVVTGVLGSGVFVSIEKFLVEGLVRLKDLPQPGGKIAHWAVSESTGRLTAPNGMSIGIGDIVTIHIVNVDLASRHLDLLMTKLPAQMPPVNLSKGKDADAASPRRLEVTRSGKKPKGKRAAHVKKKRAKRGRR